MSGIEGNSKESSVLCCTKKTLYFLLSVMNTVVSPVVRCIGRGLERAKYGVYGLINKFRHWLSSGGYEKCAGASPLVFKVCVTLGAFFLLLTISSAGWGGLTWFVMLIIVYPLISLCGALVQILGLFGEHSKKRTARTYLLRNIIPPLLLLLYVFNYRSVENFFDEQILNRIHQTYISVLKMVARS